MDNDLFNHADDCICLNDELIFIIPKSNCFSYLFYLKESGLAKQLVNKILN